MTPLSMILAAAMATTLAIASAAWAQAPASTDGSPVVGADAKILVIPIHQSAVVRAPWLIKNASVGDVKFADVKILNATQVLVQAKSLGSTDLLVANQDGEVFRVRVEIVVDLARMKEQMEKLFPRSRLELAQSNDIVFVSGQLARAEHAVQLHKYLDATGLKYVDMTSVAGVQQVLLKVKVAEVSRTAIRALGINGFIVQDDFFGGVTVGSSSGGSLNPVPILPVAGAPASGSVPFQVGSSSLTPPVTVFGGFPDINLEIFLQALAENQYLRVLAEPNLVALSGEEADFLAGGEIPLPVVQASTGTGTGSTALTIEYKEYGVRLKFTPTVLGDNSIRLKVAPEVSELSSVGAVVISGFNIPSLISRKAETTLELNSGQTFAMAGLINRTDTAVSSRIPGVGDVPIVGALFRSARYEADDTELVVMVTATLVEPMSTLKTPPVPGSEHLEPNDWEFYGMGHIEGQMPPKLSSADAAWLKETGLCKLQGPGAWESCDQAPAHSRAKCRPPQNTAPAAKAPSGAPATPAPKAGPATAAAPAAKATPAMSQGPAQMPTTAPCAK
jgi:pilus assembly protein CpaC